MHSLLCVLCVGVCELVCIVYCVCVVCTCV